MTETISVAVPRKGRPLEAVLQRIAEEADAERVTDEIISTLRYEKAATLGDQTPEGNAYERLAEYSHLDEETRPDFTLLRDDRAEKPRRIVFDSVTVRAGDVISDSSGVKSRSGDGRHRLPHPDGDAGDAPARRTASP